MQIMTKDGWVALTPREFSLPGRTPTLLERMNVAKDHDGIAEMARYCNMQGHGVYFTYTSDGRHWQSKGAINPLPGMYGE